MKYFFFIVVFSIVISQEIPSFDSNRAMELLETQCAFGPRYPGSIGHDQMRLFLKDFFRTIIRQLIYNE